MWSPVVCGLRFFVFPEVPPLVRQLCSFSVIATFRESLKVSRREEEATQAQNPFIHLSSLKGLGNGVIVYFPPKMRYLKEEEKLLYCSDFFHSLNKHYLQIACSTYSPLSVDAEHA